MRYEILAGKIEFSDLLIGGYTHTFMAKLVINKNKMEEDVISNQVAWFGIVLGRLDFVFEKNKNKKLVNTHTVVIGKISSE